MLKRHHAFDRIFADSQTTQINHMRAAAQLFTEVINDGADIGPFRTVYFQLEFITFVTNEQQLIHGNRTSFARNLNALTCIFVELFALIFQRRIHRRHL
ncbi:Uncharacterised protein [Enterobacter cloacae]|nr:Uncharacterised protein [Enterobacter cloacae]